MKTVTITTYRELFELWSTNKSFQAKYPYLYDLMNKFSGKLISCPNETNIEHYLRTRLTSRLSIEELTKYLYPLYDKLFVKDNKIHLVGNDAIDYYILGLYILHKKMPVVFSVDTSFMFGSIMYYVDPEKMVELMNYLPKLDNNNNPFSFNTKTLKIKFYLATKIEEYKPTALEVIKSKGITTAAGFTDALNIIKEHNCEWVESKEYRLYNFIKNNKLEKVDDIDLAMFLGYFDEPNLLWRWTEANQSGRAKYYVEGSKRYNVDINTVANNGSYLIHFAAQQFKSNPGWMKELLDYGARMLDKDGNLLRGWNNETIYEFYKGSDMHEFLLDYYKEDKVMCKKLTDEYNKVCLKQITIEIEEEEEKPTVDHNVMALINSIQDPIKKDKMTAYYVKLLLAKQ